MPENSKAPAAAMIDGVFMMASVADFPFFEFSGAIVEYLFYHAFPRTRRRRRGHLGNDARHRAKPRRADRFGVERISAHRAHLAVDALAAARPFRRAGHQGTSQQCQQDPESFHDASLEPPAGKLN